MWIMLLIVFFLSIFEVNSADLTLPPFIKACSKNSSDFDECVIREAKIALPYVVKGSKQYGIPNFSPLKIERIDLETAGNLKLSLSEVEIYGLDRIEVNEIKINLPARKMHSAFKVDKLIILSKYEMDGKILILPLKGKGNSNITAIGVDFIYDFTYKLKTKHGNEYAYLDKQNIEFTLEKGFLHFDNLFGGDASLGAHTNKLLNDEWKSVLDEVRPAISKAITTLAASIFNNICEKVPFKYIFP